MKRLFVTLAMLLLATLAGLRAADVQHGRTSSWCL